MPIYDATSQELALALKKSKVPVLVDFWGTRCSPCKALAPHLETLAQEKGESLLIVKVNVEEELEAARVHHVAGLPTLVLFKGGNEAARRVGMAGLPALRALTGI
jgi:thioredoxin 1